MWRDLYVAEKLRELQTENEAYLFGSPPPKGESMVWPVVRAVGRRLRRVGEGLESWAAPEVAEAEQSDLRLKRHPGEL